MFTNLAIERGHHLVRTSCRVKSLATPPLPRDPKFLQRCFFEGVFVLTGWVDMVSVVWYHNFPGCILIWVKSWYKWYKLIYDLKGITTFSQFSRVKPQVFSKCLLVIYSHVSFGWWFGTWILFFYILGMIISSDFHIFQRGRYITNQTCIC